MMVMSIPWGDFGTGGQPKGDQQTEVAEKAVLCTMFSGPCRGDSRDGFADEEAIETEQVRPVVALLNKPGMASLMKKRLRHTNR